MDTHSHGLNDTFPEFSQHKIILRWGKVKYINGEYIDYYVTHDGLWHAGIIKFIDLYIYL